jgi:hypothetical protein
MGRTEADPLGYGRAVVVNEEFTEHESTSLLWSERTSLLIKRLTKPTLLEMAG